MIDCIIVEDQVPAQRILKKYISDFGSLNLLATFNNAIDAIEYLNNHTVDLIFLDIHLPKISGFDFLKSINNAPPVILTTAFGEFALKSYEFDVVDYLLKPFSFQRFVKAVLKVSKKDVSDTQTDLATEEFIFIKSGYDHIKINVGDIRFIMSDGDYTEIHMGNNKKYLSHESLRHWLNVFPKETFVRVHKSYIVNLRYVEKVSSQQLLLKGEESINIGRTFKENFMQSFLKFSEIG